MGFAPGPTATLLTLIDAPSMLLLNGSFASTPARLRNSVINQLLQSRSTLSPVTRTRVMGMMSMCACMCMCRMRLRSNVG